LINILTIVCRRNEKWIWIQETHENTVRSTITHSTNVMKVIEQY